MAAVYLYISQLWVERAKRKAAPYERIILKALRRAKGRRIELPGIEVWLVKRATIRWRATGVPYWQDPVTANEELRWTWMQYRLWQSSFESHSENIEELSEYFLRYLKRINRKREVLDGIEIYRVKANTVRARIVGACSWGAYLKPWPDDG